MKKLILLFAIITMAIPTFASEPIAMDRQMFSERVFDFQSDDWVYLGDRPAIINFWAPWCAPCRILSRTLTQIAAEFADEIYVYKINIDEQPELARAFGVRSVPLSLFVPMEGTPRVAAGNLSQRVLRRNVNTILLNR